MVNGFTPTQMKIIESVESYLKQGYDLAGAVMMAGHDTGFMDWYVKETFLSYKIMVIKTR